MKAKLIRKVFKSSVRCICSWGPATLGLRIRICAILGKEKCRLFPSIGES
jgi:hypothetical protein